MTHAFPESLKDGILNRAQIATALAVSENTITAWMGEGMPVLEHGGNGRAYRFQLSACWVWARNYQEGERQARETAERIAREAAAAFLNFGEEEDPEKQGLSANQMRELAQAELIAMQVNERRGDLVRAGRLRERLADLFAAFQRGMTTLPDFAEREFGLEPKDVQKMQNQCDQTLLEVRRQIETMIAPAGEPVAMPSRQSDLGV